MKELVIDSNFHMLDSLSQINELEHLVCSGCSQTYLILQGFPKLSNLVLKNCNIESIQIENCDKLKFVGIDSCSIYRIAVDNCPQLEKISGGTIGHLIGDYSNIQLDIVYKNLI